ncbi:hypothetical protein GGR50DRAFT_704907 [Xylaria sp. CBS 124048]|nr:hypothetical protein GGR50DRAFT_704907 [Xylaria sp. CBS 124048]
MLARNSPGEGGHDGENQHDPGEHRKRVERSLGMTEDEVAARERRKSRFEARGRWKEEQQDTKEPSDNTLEPPANQTTLVTDTNVPIIPQPLPDIAADAQEGKPWESLVIGSNLGENLSHIEWKDREIEQQRFIVRYHEEHSPHQVKHNKRILDRLIQERSELEDNEENNMPQDQREKQERIQGRLDTLRWALGDGVCEDEKINIRAAIHGYETGQIPYSHNFTLIYAGQVVDTCRTYHEFCVNRSERLDIYFAEHGPGWLWQEPPLAGSGVDGLAMRGVCLERDHGDAYSIGNYTVHLEFTLQRDKVFKSKSKKATPAKGGAKKRKLGHTDITDTTDTTDNSDVSCQLRTLLDSGATFPIILESDVERLNIDLKKYSAQGTMRLNVIGGTARFKFYEMFVSVRSNKGASLVGKGDKAVWPGEHPELGGFWPVLVQKDRRRGRSAKYTQRLSGMVPFDVCYLSSAPTMRKLWLGEDRRDVLGTRRLPAHLRYNSEGVYDFDYPEEFEKLRQVTRTPDRVIFVHNFPSKPDTVLTDIDVAGTRGRSEMAIGEYQPEGSERAVLPKRVIRIEPRKGKVRFVTKPDPRPWHKQYLRRARR